MDYFLSIINYLIVSFNFVYRLRLKFTYNLPFQINLQFPFKFTYNLPFQIKIHSQFLMGAQASYRSSRSMVKYRSMFVGKWIVVLVTGGSF